MTDSVHVRMATPADKDTVTRVFHDAGLDTEAALAGGTTYWVLERGGQVHRTPAFVMGELFLWGYSALLTDLVLRLGGWERPWDHSRVSAVPERFARR